MNKVDSLQYCINLCHVVTSERNCVCYPCGACMRVAYLLPA